MLFTKIFLAVSLASVGMANPVKRDFPELHDLSIGLINALQSDVAAFKAAVDSLAGSQSKESQAAALNSISKSAVPVASDFANQRVQQIINQHQGQLSLTEVSDIGTQLRQKVSDDLKEATQKLVDLKPTVKSLGCDALTTVFNAVHAIYRDSTNTFRPMASFFSPETFQPNLISQALDVYEKPINQADTLYTPASEGC